MYIAQSSTEISYAIFSCQRGQGKQAQQDMVVVAAKWGDSHDIKQREREKEEEVKAHTKNYWLDFSLMSQDNVDAGDQIHIYYY